MLCLIWNSRAVRYVGGSGKDYGGWEGGIEEL